jgi:hypothetical protein
MGAGSSKVGGGSKDQAGGDYRVTRRSIVAAAALITAGVGSKAAAQSPTVVGHPGVRTDRTGPGAGGRAQAVGCLLRGTRVQTPTGQVAVEDLRIGDPVITKSGQTQPVKWIGRRRVTGTLESVPVKISRFALDANTPSADLYLTRLHTLYIEGVFIPAQALINGRTITLCTSQVSQTLEYFHVELPSHDVILAEGVEVESLLVSAGNLGGYDNGTERERLYPETLSADPAAFAPVALYGRRAELRSRLRSAISPWVDLRRPVDRARDRIDERAERKLAA